VVLVAPWQFLGFKDGIPGEAFINAVNRIPDRPGGPIGDVGRTYLKYQATVVSTLHDVQLLAFLGTPPSLVGLAWTWPIAHRALDSIAADGNRVAIAFGEVRVLGSDAVAERAYHVAEAVLAVFRFYPTG
jgi:hypothetical protein